VQLITISSSSLKMFQPYTAIIRCFLFTEIAALYGMSDFYITFECDIAWLNKMDFKINKAS
jgi:hypothetical protein